MSFKVSNAQFLPPANEIRGKVIFSEACVSHSIHGEGGMHGGGHVGGGACKRDDH